MDLAIHLIVYYISIKWSLMDLVNNCSLIEWPFTVTMISIINFFLIYLQCFRFNYIQHFKLKVLLLAQYIVRNRSSLTSWRLNDSSWGTSRRRLRQGKIKLVFETIACTSISFTSSMLRKIDCEPLHEQTGRLIRQSL